MVLLSVGTTVNHQHEADEVEKLNNKRSIPSSRRGRGPKEIIKPSKPFKQMTSEEYQKFAAGKGV